MFLFFLPFLFPFSKGIRFALPQEKAIHSWIFEFINTISSAVGWIRSYILNVAKACWWSSWKIVTFPVASIIYSVWVVNNMLGSFLALLGRPPTYYSQWSQVSELKRHVQLLERRELQYQRELEGMRREVQELKMVKKELASKFKEARKQGNEMARQLDIFRQQTHCRSGEELRVQYSIVGKLGVGMHISVLLAALCVWSLHSSLELSLQKAIIYPIALMGSWWYLILVTGWWRGSPWKMQVVYCLSWALIGLAVNERLQFATLQPSPAGWVVEVGPLVRGCVEWAEQTLVHRPMVLVGRGVEAAWGLVHEAVQKLAPSSGKGMKVEL